jgi:hypothetical protein
MFRVIVNRSESNVMAKQSRRCGNCNKRCANPIVTTLDLNEFFGSDTTETGAKNYVTKRYLCERCNRRASHNNTRNEEIYAVIGKDTFIELRDAYLEIVNRE